METETQNEMPDDGRDGKNRNDHGLAAPDTGHQFPEPTARRLIQLWRQGSPGRLNSARAIHSALLHIQM